MNKPELEISLLKEEVKALRGILTDVLRDYRVVLNVEDVLDRITSLDHQLEESLKEKMNKHKDDKMREMSGIEIAELKTCIDLTEKKGYKVYQNMNKSESDIIALKDGKIYKVEITLDGSNLKLLSKEKIYVRMLPV